MLTASKLSSVYRSATSSRPFLRSLSVSHSLGWNLSQSTILQTTNNSKEVFFFSKTSSKHSSTSLSLIRTMATAAPSTAVSADPKLSKLREILSTADNGNPVDAFIVPSEDPHMSEYPPECDARRSYISNFDGSAGTAVITSNAAALWTDGRYFLQAESQLGDEWTLMKGGVPGTPEIHEWLVSVLPPNAAVAIDPTLHTIDAAERLKTYFEANNIRLVLLTTNPVDAAWGAERPPPPTTPVRIHPLEWSGKSVADKLTEIREEMKKMNVDVIPVTMLDEVAWLFNLRGSDVPYNPVFLSYGLVTLDSAVLFIDPKKINESVGKHLSDAGVVVQSYETAFDAVEEHAKAGKVILMDPGKVSFAMKAVATKTHTTTGAAADGNGNEKGQRKRSRTSSSTPTAPPPKTLIKQQTSPLGVYKAIKNDTELRGMQEAHLRDGVALAKFFFWLENTILKENRTLTECEIDEKLCSFRAAQPGFIEPSFPTIAGAGPNGAIIHYRPLPESCRSVDGNTLLLLDSGGQFDCGTTDITRTMHMGSPSAHQKKCFTAVLQGHIQLDTAVFPEGTPGCALDVLARTPLWKLGLNYRHGTGHGVGAALNVHEGPQSISSRFGNTQPLLPDMICSNEPGYYEDGAFGIRIENLFVVVEAPTEFRFAGQSYYTCRHLTMAPLQKKMIDTSMLSEGEVAWVNSYHEEVWNEISPRLEKEGCADEMAWLREATLPL